MLCDLSIVAVLILILLNIERDNRRWFFLRDRNSQLSIMHFSMNVQFMIFDIAAYCNDSDYSQCRLLCTSLSHLRWLKMMTIVFTRSRNRSMQISIRRYEMCRVSSLIVITSADTLLLILLELCKNQSFYDSVSLTIYLFWYFWLIIIEDLLFCSQMNSFDFYSLNASDFLVLWLIFSW